MFSQPAGQNVLQRGLPPDQLMLLEDHRRLRAVFANVPVVFEGVVFGIHHPSARGRNQKVQGAQQGRFAGAGRAEQNRDLVIHEIQGKGVKSPGAVGINHLDVPNSDYRIPVAIRLGAVIPRLFVGPLIVYALKHQPALSPPA